MLNAKSGSCGLNLVSNVRASITDVTVHLAHDSDMLVTVEQRVLILAMHASSTSATMYSFVRFKAGIRKNHDEPLGVLVGWWDGSVLLCDQLRKCWWRKRLSP